MRNQAATHHGRSTADRRSRGRAAVILVILLVFTELPGGFATRAAGSSENPPPPPTVAGARIPPRQTEAEVAAASDSDSVHSEYYEVLRMAGTGEPQSPEAMAELQRVVFRSGSLAGLSKLHRFQLAAAKALTAEDATGYRPIVWLQYESVGCLTAREDYALRVPSLMLAVDLADSMRRAATSAENRLFATDVMVCSARSLLRDGNKTRAASLFERVIRIEPGNAPALLGSAAIHERQGHHEDAARQLRRMVKAHPTDAEGRLRLAVNLARLDEHEHADRLLRELVADSDVPWVRAVAYQELVRDLVAKRQLGQAEKVLRQAVADHPGNHSLRIQRALVLDLMGRPHDAAQVIEAIQPELDDAGASPRWIYAEWPSLEVAEREGRLRDLAASASATLIEALRTQREAEAS